MRPPEDFLPLIQRRLAEQKIDLGPDEDMLTSGVIDSIGMMRLIAELERDIGRSVPPTGLVPENFYTPRVMAGYLASLGPAG